MKLKYILTYNRYTRPVILLCVFCIVYFVLKVYFYFPTTNSVSYTNNNFYVFDLTIPSNLHFCGEKIPSNNIDIRKDLEKEFFSSNYWKNNSRLLFNKGKRWFPYIEPILKAEGIPDDFKYLCVIESHLSNVSSSAGAAGFWQLVPSSARNYGLEVNSQVDERYHVEKATHAACEHIMDAYRVFKNWTLAAAAYNRGIGGIQKAMQTQKTNSYHKLLLNKETGSFVYRIMAYKTLFSSPGHFGLKKKKWVNFSKIPMKQIKVDSTINNISKFESQLNLPKGILKKYNPWLLGNELDNLEKKVYVFHVPKNMNADYSAYVNDMETEVTKNFQAAGSNPDRVLEKKDSLMKPVKSYTFVVKETESLKSVASFLKVSELDLKKWNKLGDQQTAVAGQTLVVYLKE